MAPPATTAAAVTAAAATAASVAATSLPPLRQRTCENSEGQGRPKHRKGGGVEEKVGVLGGVRFGGFIEAGCNEAGFDDAGLMEAK